MTRLLVSTVRRRIPANEPSGYLYTIDYPAQRVLQRSLIVEPAFREMDDNPRGGMRGSKGISVRDDQIALSNFSMVFRYDPHWNLLGVITHPSCAGIHDILFQDETLWVAAARADLLLQFDLNGNLLQHFYMRERSPALKALGWKPPILLNHSQIREGKIEFRDPRKHEKETYDHAHVNSMGFLPNGDMLVSLGFVYSEQFATLLRLKIWLVKLGAWSMIQAINQHLRAVLGLKKKTMDTSLAVKPAKAQSAIIRISPRGEHSLSLALENMTAPSHSLLVLPDATAIYLNTSEGTVIHFEPLSGTVFSSTPVTTGGFLRGVTLLNHQTLLLGSRGELITFDLPKREVLSRMALSDDANEAIYDIKVLPPHYDMPPLSFVERFRKETGYKDAADLIAQRHNSVQFS